MSESYEIGKAVGNLDTRLSQVETDVRQIKRAGILAVLSLSGVSAILRNDVLADIAEKILHALLK